MDMVTRLKARKQELTEQRDLFLQQANGTIAAYNGAIAEVDNMIASLGADGDDEAEAAAVLNGRKLATKRKERV